MARAWKFDEAPIEGPTLGLRERLGRLEGIESAIVPRLTLRARLGAVVAIFVSGVLLAKEDRYRRLEVAAELGDSRFRRVDTAKAERNLGFELRKNVGRRICDDDPAGVGRRERTQPAEKLA